MFLVQDRSNGSLMEYADLPTEFFSHQLIELHYLLHPKEDEISNADDLLPFCAKWGLPFTPYGKAIYGGRQDQRNCTAEIESVLTEWEETERITESYSPGFLPSLLNRGLYVSVAEALSAVNDLALFALRVEEIANGANSAFGISDIYNAAYPHSDFHWISRNYEDVTQIGSVFNFSDIRRGGLTSAVCRQMVETISDPAPWRECACVGCDRMFKRKQGARNPHRDSVYCCKQCEERQRKRNQRKAAKNRIDHGL